MSRKQTSKQARIELKGSTSTVQSKQHQFMGISNNFRQCKERGSQGPERNQAHLAAVVTCAPARFPAADVFCFWEARALCFCKSRKTSLTLSVTSALTGRSHGGSWRLQSSLGESILLEGRQISEIDDMSRIGLK